MADQIAELRDLMVQQFREVRADHARLEEFLARHFAKIEVRFTGVEDRLARVEVVQEEMRSDFRAFGESLSHVIRRIEALES